MKKRFILLSAFSLFCFASFSQSLSINTDGSPAHASALLDVKSTEKGFLAPRMTTIPRDAIAFPATGLEIYNILTQTKLPH